MSYGFGDLIGDVLTGGMYSATKISTEAGIAGAQAIAGVAQAAAGAAQAAAGAVGQAAGGCSGTSTGPASPPQAVVPKCCCTYSIEGDYLLNCETGAMWLINREGMEIKPFKRSMNKMEGAAGALRLQNLLNNLLDQKEKELAGIHHSLRDVMSKRMDTVIDTVKGEIADLAKIGGGR